VELSLAFRWLRDGGPVEYAKTIQRTCKDVFSETYGEAYSEANTVYVADF
jgi:hypothetical protein